MALINCPECNKEVSDKASACIHCGFPLTITIHKDEEIEINQEKKYLYNVYITSVKNQTKEFFDFMKLRTNLDKNLIENIKFRLPCKVKENVNYIVAKGFVDDIAKLNVNDLVCTMEKTILNKEYEQPKMQSTNQVKCPKCKSTQIQAVPRKWSLMTGILTNKVDRVCLNCKHKF